MLLQVTQIEILEQDKNMTEKEKEKAKAYDEAIERTKKLYSNGIAKEIFP